MRNVTKKNLLKNQKFYSDKNCILIAKDAIKKKLKLIIILC